MKAEISTMQEKIDREGAKAPEKQQNEGVRSSPDAFYIK